MTSAADGSSMSWDELKDFIATSPPALELVLEHLEGTGKIPPAALSKHANKITTRATDTTDAAGAAAGSTDTTDATGADVPDVLSTAEAASDITRRLNVLVERLKSAKLDQPAKKRVRGTGKKTSKKEELPTHLWWFPIIDQPDQYNKLTLGGNSKRRMASLASHLGLRDDEFRARLNAAGALKYKSWAGIFGVPVQTTKEGSITWVVLDEAVDQGTGWSHTPRDQCVGNTLKPSWVARPTEGHLEGVSAEEKSLGKMSRATIAMIDKLVKDMTDNEILAELEATAKKSRTGTMNSLVEYKIADRTFSLPCNYQPVRKKKYDELEKEVNDLRSRNGALEAELAELKDAAAEDEPYTVMGRAL
eukprot:CAMPEP_0178676302 /NCGR_PEP_ID=MMETSP0698-20121128/35845_1 /TAXON_ID=265572 /ORGANISM="Extubocellulus spinifer, Strain CCMP396" /LENGTH=361 /DNA_ID=CAMNT_0020320535 /DNA_START=153 /DNA_END=1235 /DNA_ORIENTATION=-